MIPGLPPLSFSGGHASGGQAGGASGYTQGDWTVNLAGSGTALQAGGSGLLWLAVGLGVLWLLTRK